jgi:hypothetical protein
MWVPFEVPTRSQRSEHEARRPSVGGVDAWWYSEDIRVHREHVRVMEERRAASKALADSFARDGV